MSDAITSINIMVMILLIGVSICIYWIFKYDDWYPNPIVSGDKSERIPDRYDGQVEAMGVGAE